MEPINVKPSEDIHQLQLDKLNELVYAGKATITLFNTLSGNWYTYQIKGSRDKAGKERVFFVSVLRGNDNGKDYTFVGTIFGDKYRGKKFRLSDKALSFNSKSKSILAINYFVENMDKLPTNLKVYHMGTCLKCGRALTTPESIKTGLGPECGKRAKQIKGIPVV